MIARALGPRHHDEFSEDPAFFQPMHLSHLAEKLPAVVAYLGIPPGWRIQLAPGYEDVWEDPALLEV